MEEMGIFYMMDQVVSVGRRKTIMGKRTIESSPGKGTAFIIKLPF
jgi:chemotaxis protein histidine kinase CheA